MKALVSPDENTKPARWQCSRDAQVRFARGCRCFIIVDVSEMRPSRDAHIGASAGRGNTGLACSNHVAIMPPTPPQEHFMEPYTSTHIFLHYRPTEQHISRLCLIDDTSTGSMVLYFHWSFHGSTPNLCNFRAESFRNFLPWYQRPELLTDHRILGLPVVSRVKSANELARCLPPPLNL